MLGKKKKKGCNPKKNYLDIIEATASPLAHWYTEERSHMCTHSSWFSVPLK